MHWFRSICLVIAILVIGSGGFLAKDLRSLSRIKDHDISLQPSVKPTSTNVWLVSYADGEVHLANQRYLTFTALNKGIDFYQPYNKKHIDPAYIQTHNQIFSQNRGAGYWLWKPYLILKTLDQIPQNDIVLYVDSGARIIRPVNELVSQLTSQDVLIFQSSTKNRHYIKRELFKMMGSDNHNTRHAYQLVASVIMVKNTPAARNLIKTWLHWCENERALTDIKSQGEYPDFMDHRHDQAILTLLSMQNPANIKIMPSATFSKYFTLHRRTGFDEGSLF